MLERAGQLISRFRAAIAQPSDDALPRRWSDDLAAARVTASEWIVRRLASASVYADVDDDRLERLRRERAPLAAATIESARRILRHEFDLLGSGPYVPVDPARPRQPNGYQPIDWYLDPVSRQRFPTGIRLEQWNFERMRPRGADIKLPWELARCQHWAVLGQAYRLTGEGRYAIEIADELCDFIDANPVGTAVNWACTMDVALRAANWALALNLVRSCPALPPPFWHRAYESLFDHGVFIETHLENTYEVTSNHFLSNVIGLFFLASVFDDLRCGERWDRQCRSWLEQEMHVQVLDDGADYESSVPYHRFVAEMFLAAARLADWRRRPLPQAFQTRFGAMIDFLAAVQRPDGLMPQVGDADDGRVHILSAYGCWKPQDARHLFGPAAALLRNRAWAALSDEWGPWETAWWGFDPDATSRDRTADDESSNAVRGAGDEPRGIRHFPRAGLTVLRRHRDYLLVTNGIVGTGGFGNHKHNDQLAFEFHVDGTPVFVDPGSYVYTSDPEARNLFRSTRSHNTLSVDGEEQNELRPDWLFRMFEKANPEHLFVGERNGCLIYRGRHLGYTRLEEPIVHERELSLSLDNGALAIVDALSGRGAHVLRWRFTLAPGVEATILEHDEIEIRPTANFLRMQVPRSLRPSIDSTWYSPSYGVRLASMCIELETSVNGNCEFVFRLTP